MESSNRDPMEINTLPHPHIDEYYTDNNPSTSILLPNSNRYETLQESPHATRNAVARNPNSEVLPMVPLPPPLQVQPDQPSVSSMNLIPPSPPPAQTNGPLEKNSFTWNEKFQLLLDSLPSEFLSREEEFAPVQSFCWDLLRLSKDFVHLASLYGKIIISEKALSDAEKTIKPASVGGFAGGRKYLKRGILFKFPQVDEYGIYGGVDEWAAKAGGHELKGLMGFKSAGIRELRLPLLALIDYRGYRLCAVSLLPVNSNETLMYGSSDGGKTVMNKHQEISSLMEEFGKRMNLKKHNAGREITSLISGPADIEVHLGTDGRYYVLDLARVFPPEAPTEARTHLYNLFRPEFIRTYKDPLSSDAFSRMVPQGEEAIRNNDEVRAASKYLNEITIPMFVKEFEVYLGIKGNETSNPKMFDFLGTDGFKTAQKTLIEEMHRTGINIRHLGLVRQHAKSPELRQAIMVEMISRVLKVNLRKKWRQKMDKNPSAELESFKHVTAKYLNLALGTSDRGSLHWAFDLIPQLFAKFSGALTKEERSVQEGRSFFQNLGLRKLVTLRVATLCGIEFSAKFLAKIEEDQAWFYQESPIPELHITNINPVIKTSNTIPYVEGMLLLHSSRKLGVVAGIMSPDPLAASLPKTVATMPQNFPTHNVVNKDGDVKDVADRTWVLKSAARKFKDALRAAPGGRVEILALSYVLYQRALLNPAINKAVRYLDIARHKLKYLKRTYPRDKVAHLLFADVVQLSAELRSNAETMKEAIQYYSEFVQEKSPGHQKSPHAYLQCGRAYLSIYYFAGKKVENLAQAHEMAVQAVDCDPQSGPAWHLRARTLALLAIKEKNLAMLTFCDEAFQKAQALCPKNVYVLYQWGSFLLRKAATFDSVDALLAAALKLKTAVENEPKIDHYNAVRECLSALESHFQQQVAQSPQSTSSSSSLAGQLAAQHASAIQEWIRVLRTNLEKWKQQHTTHLGGQSHIIDWEDLDILSPLGNADMKFMFRARWHPNKHSLASSTSSIFAPQQQQQSQDLRNSRGESKDVAVKVIKRNMTSSDDIQRFENEIRVYAHLGRDHPNVSTYYGISFDEEHMIIVGEYLERGALKEWLLKSFPDGVQTKGFWPTLLRVAEDITRGIGFLHESLVLWNNFDESQCLVAKDGTIKIAHFHSSRILPPDDPMSEAECRSEIVKLGNMLLHLLLTLWRSEKEKPSFSLTASASGSSKPRHNKHDASVPAEWPQSVRDMFDMMIRTDRLSAREIADRIDTFHKSFVEPSPSPASTVPPTPHTPH